MAAVVVGKRALVVAVGIRALVASLLASLLCEPL